PVNPENPGFPAPFGVNRIGSNGSRRVRRGDPGTAKQAAAETRRRGRGSVQWAETQGRRRWASERAAHPEQRQGPKDNPLSIALLAPRSAKRQQALSALPSVRG